MSQPPTAPTAPLPPEHPVAVGRKMLAEDALWIADAVFSSSESRQKGILPLLLMGHTARIVYEGSVLIRSSTPGVGQPDLACRLPASQTAVIEKARHATKLFDDTSRPYQILLQEMDAYLFRARADFLGNTPYRWARRWETDLGTYRHGSNTVGITPTVAYRMGYSAAATHADLAKEAFPLSHSQGQALGVLIQADGQTQPLTPTLNYKRLGYLGLRDRRSDKYLSGRYDTAFTEALKLVLLHIEADLNSTLLVLPHTAIGHEEAAFRARVVTTYHALNALAEVDAAHPQAASPDVTRLRALLGSPERQRLNSAHGRQVRNRCMHYEIRAKTGVLNPALPLNGIVEALPGGRPYADYRADIDTVLAEATSLMCDWGAK